MGSEPDSVSAWTEQHSIMNDPTFVGTGAAALLGCMAQFEQSLCAVSERYRPTIFLDPRENQHGWLVPSSLDKELWKAKIVSGSLPPPIGCVQKKYAVHFPCAVGCPDITEQDWGPRSAHGRTFQEPAVSMWEVPAVEPDVVRPRDQEGHRSCFVDTKASMVNFPSRLQMGACFRKGRLRAKVHFSDQPVQTLLNRWIQQACRLDPPALSQYVQPVAGTTRSTGRFPGQGCTGSDNPCVDPPLGPGRPEGPPRPRPSRTGVSMLTQMMAQQAHLVPAALEVLREAKLPQVRDVVEVGSPRDGGRVPYDLFEPDQGRRTRQANVEWRIEELVQDAVHAVAYTVRCVQFPRRPIPRTYKPNVVMTPSRAGRHSLALPVDVRDFGAGIVTVLVRHEMLMDEVLQQVVDKTGGRLQHLLNLFQWRQVYFTDSCDRHVEFLVAPLVQYDWLALKTLPDGSVPPTGSSGQGVATAAEPPAEWPNIQLPPANLLFIPEPSAETIVRAANIRLAPAVLHERDAFTSAAHSFKWARVTRDTLGYFTVFDTHRHASIGECGVHIDLETLVAQAIQSAPFEVEAIQILTDPVPEYPRPQLVLREAGRPWGTAPIPWDLRGVDRGIRTVEHVAGQALSEALQHVDQVAPGRPSLTEGVSNAAIVVHDALGPVQRIIPRDLQSIQYFRALPAPTAIRFSEVQGPRFMGSSHMHEGTTISTTWMQALSVPPLRPALRLIIFRGEWSVAADLSYPYHMLDEMIARMLHQLSDVQHLPVGAGVVLSGALPPPNGYLQEVPLVVVEPMAGIPYVWDARPVGGGFQVLSAEAGTPPSRILSQSWRHNEWRLAVNGVPEEYCDRVLRPGDYLQPFHGDQPQPAGPLGHVFDMCPGIAAYAWFVPVRPQGLALGSTASIFEQLAHNLRGRRHAMGAHFVAAGTACVYGATHNVVCLHFPDAGLPSVQAVADALQELDQPQPWHELTRAAAVLPDTAIFTSHVRGAQSSTILLPAPGHRDHFFVLWVRPGTQLLRDLPAEARTELFPRRNLRTGDVLFFRPQSPDRPEAASSEGHSLLQLHAARVERRKLNPDRTGLHIIPTPGGRRRVPALAEAPVRIDLEACLPEGRVRNSSDERILRLPVPHDAVQLAFQSVSLAGFRSEVPDTQAMHPAAALLLAHTPVAARSAVVDALLFFVDGSYRAPYASWAVACFARSGDTWFWWGYLADRVADSFEAEGAFVGELYGQLVALCAGAGTGVPFTICYDCDGAASVAKRILPSVLTVPCAVQRLR